MTSTDLLSATQAALSRFESSPVAGMLREARPAAERGDGDTLARTLSELGEAERFLATMCLGALHPAAAVEAARALERALDERRAEVRWSDFAPLPLVERWARGLIEAGEAELAGRLVQRAFYMTAGDALGRLVAERVAASDHETAEILFAAIDPLAKAARATARARSGIARGDDAAIVQAVHDASGPPIIQDGGEEVEALAALLDALAPLPPEHDAVEAAVATIVRFVTDHVDRKDVRSHGAALAAAACARASSPERSQWLVHARKLSEWTFHPKCKHDADAAIAAAEARLCGEPTEEAPATSPQPEALRPLLALRNEERFERRARGASGHIARAIENGDTEAVYEALAVALEAAAPRDASDAERAMWAAALFDGGADEEAAGAMLELARTCVSPNNPAYVVAPSAFFEALPRIGDRARARALVEIALERGLACTSSGRDEQPAAGPLAQLAAGDDALEDALLRAVLEVRQYEGSAGSVNQGFRQRRIGALLERLAEAHAGEVERLDRWSELVPPSDRPRLAAAGALLAPLGLAEAERRCGALEPPEALSLTRALARAGRFEDALELATRQDVSLQQHALLAIGAVELDAKQARALVARFRKAPRRRDAESQGTYQHRFARLHLMLDRVDDALAILAKMRDCRVSGHGPAYLAYEILERLEARPAEASPERVRAILAALAGPSVIPQELARVVTGALRRAYAVADAALRAQIVEVHAGALRAKLPAGDAAMVDAGLGAALGRAGLFGEADAAFERAVRAARDGRRIHFWGSALIGAAAHAELAARRPELFAQVFGTLALTQYPSAEHAVSYLDAAGRAGVPGLLSGLPAQLATALVEPLASAAARAGELSVLESLLSVARDEQSALTVARHAAMALARAGRREPARAVASLCGLS